MSSQNLNVTLTKFPALTTPITTAQSATLTNNVAAIQNWDARQVLALTVYSLTYLLQSAGGTDYRTNIKQLRIDATAFTGGFEVVGTDGREAGGFLDRMDAVTAWSAAANYAGSTISSNTNTILGAFVGLEGTPESTLRLFIIYMRYACAVKGA